jgi:uncharacterized protein GlcG (DUF336 family)
VGDDAVTQRDITLARAREIVGAAKVRAAEVGASVSIAVVDRYGELKALARMDSARAHTVEVARQKAQTSAIVGFPTQAAWEMVKDDPARVTLLSRVPELMFLGGGRPVTVEDEVIGAVGLSGAATPEMDDQIAAASLGQGS